MSDQVERLAKLSGEGQGRAPKYTVPLIRFNGNEGSFRTVDLDFKEETPIEKPVNVIILKKRKVLSSFSPTASYFTNEYSSPNQTVNLYKNIDGTVTFEKAGMPVDLRQEFQALRTKEVLYVLYGGAVHKLEVKGGSLGDYYDYLNLLQEEDLHSFQVVTSISSVKTENESKFKYHKMTFTKGEATDLNEITPHMEKVVAELEKVDDYFAQKNAEAFRMTGANVEAKAEIPTIQVDEDINPDDIPF